MAKWLFFLFGPTALAYFFNFFNNGLIIDTGRPMLAYGLYSRPEYTHFCGFRFYLEYFSNLIYIQAVHLPIIGSIYKNINNMLIICNRLLTFLKTCGIFTTSKERMKMARIDLSGQKFGRLLVIEYVYSKAVGKRGDKKPYYKCRCDCGKEVIISGESFKHGGTKSCGCLAREKSGEILRRYNKDVENHNYHFTHRMTYTRLYKTFEGMKERCYNPHNKKYPIYGGKGIKICDEWLNDKGKFFEWAMANGYNDTLTIDRIDSNGNYEPSNCRWADIKTQNNNRSICKYITYNGMKKTISQWAIFLNIKASVLFNRFRNGWTVERALTEGVR